MVRILWCGGICKVYNFHGVELSHCWCCIFLYNRPSNYYLKLVLLMCHVGHLGDELYFYSFVCNHSSAPLYKSIYIVYFFLNFIIRLDLRNSPLYHTKKSRFAFNRSFFSNRSFWKVGKLSSYSDESRKARAVERSDKNIEELF